jgi:aryl-alcohol dehydrogenase-like predicted oxidoreductase
MKYRYLGASGLLVSRLSLGTMTFGAGSWGCDEREAHAILKLYLDAGGNFIDGADVYAGGKSEEIIGTFLPQVSRERVVLASKVYFPVGTGPNTMGLSRKRIVASCEASLQRLRTDYLDLYYIHGPDPVTPYEETMRALDDLVRQGKVRYLGCSNLFAWQMVKAAGVAARLTLAGLVAGQFLYNLIQREPERELLPAAMDQGIGLVAYAPLGAGLLTGKYRGMADPPEQSRFALRKLIDGGRFWHPRGLEIARAVDEVSKQSGIPMARLALAWPLGRKALSAVVVGVKSTDQLKENLEAGDWDVPADVWRALEERTRPADDYLTWFNRMNYEKIFGAAEYHDERADLF